MFKKLMKIVFRNKEPISTESNEPDPEKEDKPEKQKQKKIKKQEHRTCPCCGRTLELSEFTIVDEHGNRERLCSACLGGIKSFNKKDFIQRLKTRCVFTGNPDKVVCDFHHQFGTKSFTLSNRKKSTVGTIMTEAVKCIICDSNSHRLIHEYHRDGEVYEDKISFSRDHIRSYMLEYYVNFINECYAYIKLLYGSDKKNFETYVPRPEFRVNKQIRDARCYLFTLIAFILVREKYLGL